MLLNFKLRNITHVATKVHTILWRFVVLLYMDAWCYRISVACDNMEFEFSLLSPPLVWFTPLGLPKQCDICMHQHWTSGVRRRRRRHSTHGHMKAMRGCGLTSLVACNNAKIRDIRERKVTIRSDIRTTNIRSLGFWEIREWVIL